MKITINNIFIPDFINASPKSGFAVFEVKKRFDSKVLLCEEEGPGKVGSTPRMFYADCGNSFCSIKNIINTHVNVVEGNNPLKFLVHFIGNETNADVRFYSSFRKVKYRPHMKQPGLTVVMWL